MTQFTAKLKDARGNIIVVTREDGTDCMVQLPDDITSLNFNAKAVPGFLRRGTPVRFAMTIGPNGAPMSPVEKIEIFAPRAGGSSSQPSDAIHPWHPPRRPTAASAGPAEPVDGR